MQLKVIFTEQSTVQADVHYSYMELEISNFSYIE
jgi:hypothetical protein